MAGTYPDIPGERIAYDLDSKILLQYNQSGWVTLSESNKKYLNNEKTQTLLAQYTASNFQVIFPTAYDIYGIFASTDSYGFDFGGEVFISTNTTNGSDGTWTSILLTIYPIGATHGFFTDKDYRSQIATIAGAVGIKGIRFSSRTTGTNSQYMRIENFHIYGSRSSSSERIEFWKSDNSAELLPQDWDFGDTVEGSSQIKEFKIKNYLGDNISSLNLNIDIPSDSTTSILTQYLLSVDQVNWNNNINIPSTTGQIIANNGGLSETVYLKALDTNLQSSGLFMGRVSANVTKYDRPYWTVNGNSSFITTTQNFTDQIQVIPASSGQAGSSWYSKVLSLPVSIDLSYTVSNSNVTTGGDGFVIAFMDKNNKLNSLGGTGGSLGMSDSTKILQVPTRAVGISIDCFQNAGERSVPYLSSYDTHNYYSSSQTNTSTLTTSEVNGTHTMSISITETSATVSIDGIQKWTSTDFPKMLPSEFYIGYGSGSGSAFARLLINGVSVTSSTYGGTSPSQVTSGALVNFDIANPSCYSGSGSTITDLSGNNNTGNIFGGVQYNSKHGGILQFDGSTGYISLPSTSFSNFTSGYSIVFTANLGPNGRNISFPRLIDFGSATSSNNFIVYRVGTSTTLGFGFYNNGSLVVIENVNNNIPNNQMSHYALVHNGTNFLVYRNGLLMATQASTTLPQNQTRSSCYIGRNFNGGEQFEGEISTLKIFNRAISAAEALQDFQATRTRYNI